MGVGDGEQVNIPAPRTIDQDPMGERRRIGEPGGGCTGAKLRDGRSWQIRICIQRRGVRGAARPQVADFTLPRKPSREIVRDRTANRLW